MRAAAAAADRPVAIRIGVNAGSLPRDLRDKAPRDPAAALVEAALRWAEQFDEWDFLAYKLSVKSSSVPVTIAAYRLLAERSDAPLHVGVTEAGTVWSGTIKSAVGIGDTIRVSLTGDPVEEVRVAWKILAALDLRRRGPEVISCPTCGRTDVDIVGLAEEVERRLAGDAALAGRAITVAVMGCRVNGPEEARHADYGCARRRGVAASRGRCRDIKHLAHLETASAALANDVTSEVRIHCGRTGGRLMGSQTTCAWVAMRGSHIVTAIDVPCCLS